MSNTIIHSQRNESNILNKINLDPVWSIFAFLNPMGIIAASSLAILGIYYASAQIHVFGSTYGRVAQF